MRAQPQTVQRFCAAVAGLLLSTAALGQAGTSPARNVFWSGHSLTDPPIPQMLAEISDSFGVAMRWNRQSMAGASMEARTRGRPPNPDGWDGYRQGSNRDTAGLDLLEEFRTSASVGGDGYDVLVITEVHDFLWSLVHGDTVRLLRHYHERFIEGNPAAQTYFYQSWLNLYDRDDPRTWIAYEQAAEPVWQCIATRVNTSLAAEGRADRLLFIPAGLALTELVAVATRDAGIAGLSAASVPATLDLIFRDTVHLTDAGSYFVALVVYAFVNGASPAGAWSPDTMTETTAVQLQQLAWRFRNDYLRNNRPLTLEECSTVVRTSFAEQFWRFLDGRTRANEMPLHEAVWHSMTGPPRMRRNIRETEQRFAAEQPENPFRYDPETDSDWWHPAE